MAERAVIAGSETPAAGRHENLAPQADLMNQQQIPFDKQTAIRFIQAVRIFANSEFGWQAKLMFAGTHGAITWHQRHERSQQLCWPRLHDGNRAWE